MKKASQTHSLQLRQTRWIHKAEDGPDSFPSDNLTVKKASRVFCSVVFCFEASQRNQPLSRPLSLAPMRNIMLSSNVLQPWHLCALSLSLALLSATHAECNALSAHVRLLQGELWLAGCTWWSQDRQKECNTSTQDSGKGCSFAVMMHVDNPCRAASSQAIRGHRTPHNQWHPTINGAGKEVASLIALSEPLLKLFEKINIGIP